MVVGLNSEADSNLENKKNPLRIKVYTQKSSWNKKNTNLKGYN